MINPYIKSLKSEKTESGVLYGQFLINSLGLGQGITIGNLLRRVLLGDVGGTSITAIRIAGVRDEFSIITGVREDILEILLNVKGIILKSNKTYPQYGRLKVQGPAIVTANFIQLPPDLQVVNPNHYIATISTGNFLEIEFKFEYGTGYKLASQTFQDKSGDFLQIDAVYMPVQKVDFKIENVYENSNDISERLIIDIWTNGSISPEDAISEASQFIADLFNSILDNKFATEIKEPDTQSLTIAKDGLLTSLNPIEDKADLIKKVLPEPRSPFSTTLSPVLHSDINSTANFADSSGVFVLILDGYLTNLFRLHCNNGQYHLFK